MTDGIGANESSAYAYNDPWSFISFLRDRKCMSLSQHLHLISSLSFDAL